MISCILLYDVIKDLLGKTLSEFRVELLLKILRSKQGVESFSSFVHVHRFRAATPARRSFSTEGYRYTSTIEHRTSRR